MLNLTLNDILKTKLLWGVCH